MSRPLALLAFVLVCLLAAGPSGSAQDRGPVIRKGDFDTEKPGHHGTPQEREDAWKAGFDSGDPSSCSRYLEAAG